MCLSMVRTCGCLALYTNDNDAIVIATVVSVVVNEQVKRETLYYVKRE